MSQTDEMQVTLHIGGSKCGSSAIQAYLKQNEDALRTKRVLIPGRDLDLVSPVTGEQIWMFENAAMAGDLKALGARIKTLVAEAKKKDAKALIISAENICNHAHLAPMLARVLKNCSVRVVLYVRRQDDFLISSWQQWHLKRFASVEAFLSDRVGKVACWASVVGP